MVAVNDIAAAKIFAVTSGAGRRRPMRQWAEETIILPRGGPHEQQAFRVSRQPFTGLLLDEIDSDRWNVIAISGPSQSSKTLTAFAIPTIHAIAELQENLIIGVPEADMADDKWKADILPIMDGSEELRRLLPKRGAGSKGGKVRDRIDFTNGVSAKIMTAGGQDTGKAGFTARIINITEAAGFSFSTQTSRETDSLGQFKARQRAFRRESRRIIVEGTMTIPSDLPYRLKGDDRSIISSMSQLLTPCPHCGAWISPEREHFGGYETAHTEMEAIELASFFCPACGQVLSEEDRIKANQDIRIVHHGQTIDAHGDVHGELPPTTTLWFRWSQWHNLLLPSADHAADEWSKLQMGEGTEEQFGKEKELCQFVWAVPYDPPLVDLIPLTSDEVYGRTSETLRAGMVPDKTVRMSCGVDIRGTQVHSVVIAWQQEGSGHIVDFSVVPIDRAHYGERKGILFALRQLRDRKLEPGYRDAAGKVWQPGVVFIDAGWRTEVVRAFIRECLKMGLRRYYPSFGRGQSQPKGKGSYVAPTKTTTDTVYIGDQFHIKRHVKHGLFAAFINSDEWKTNVHDAFATPLDQAGAISIFEALTESEVREARTFARQITAEKAREKVVPGRGPVIVWENDSRTPNHYLDCTYNAMAAGHLAGVRLIGDQKATQPPRPAPQPARQATNQQQGSRFTTPHGRPFLISNRD